MTRPRRFLTAEWRWLAMLNWRVAPELLRDAVPKGTVLDAWHGATFVSVVGFLFRDTRVLGIPIPFHRTFEEVNLRIYVRREVAGEVRRAVVFVRELVPRRAIAAVARWTYDEPYRACPMTHRYGAWNEAAEAPRSIEYGWRHAGSPYRLAVDPTGTARVAPPESEQAFITEHFWGYTRQRDGGTIEYRVEHPRWRVWDVTSARLEGDLESLYGAELGRAISRPPDSAFLAEGSAVTVHAPERLPV